MKQLVKITLFFVLTLILSYPNVNAEEVEFVCRQESNNVMELGLCGESTKSNDRMREFSLTTVFDLTSAVSSSYYNSMDEGIVTSVKDQKNNNACWAFTSTSLLETQILKKELIDAYDIDLSESHLFYNTARNGFSDVTLSTYNRSLLTGGNAAVASSYYFAGKGPTYESNFPHSDDEMYVQLSYADNYVGNPAFDIDKYEVETHFNGEVCTDFVATMKSKIVEYGSIGVNIFFDPNYFVSSTNGFFYNYQGTETSVNHSVTLVGWDDTIAASNFLNATVDGAWIAKNSWGTSWGDAGYFYISYEDIAVCTEMFNFSVKGEFSYDKTFSSSELSANTKIRYGTSATPTYVSSLFEDVGNVEISKVSFAITDNVNYTVYLSKNNSLYDDSDWVELGSGNASLRGVHSVYFDPIKVNDSFTIIIKYKSNIADTKETMYVMCPSLLEESVTYGIPITRGKNYAFSSITGPKDDIALLNESDQEYDGCKNVIYVFAVEPTITSENDDYSVSDETIFVSLKNDKELTKENFLDNLVINGNYKIYDSAGQDVTNTATNIGTNYKVVVDDSINYSIIVKGDVSGDGFIKSNDALLISRSLVGLTVLNGSVALAADVSNDTTIRSNDSLLISRFLVGLVIL